MESKEDTNSHQENANPVIPPVSPEGKEEHSPTREPAANQKPNNDKNISNVLMVIFTGVLAAAAIGQFIVFFFQWSVMSNQLAVMDNQLREMREGGKDTHDLAVATEAQAAATKSVAGNALAQVEATKRLAGEARRSANIADNALRTSLNLSAEDRRPWIGLYGFIDKADITKKPLVPYLIGTMANSGKTPAVNVRVEVKSRIIDFFSGEPTFDNSAKSGVNITNDEVAIPPNGRKDFSILQGISFGDIQWDKGIVWYVMVRITYSDTGRNGRYKTDFCLRNDMGHGFRPCFTGHDMK